MNLITAPEVKKAGTSIEKIYPLSPMQQGMLFHTLLEPDSGAYIIQVSYLLEGELAHDRFESAWQALVARHSILRSAFVWQNLEQPLQVVGKEAHCPLQHHDWREESPIDQSQKLAQLLAQQRQRGFTLSKAPLMQVTLIQLAENRYQFVWHYHHLLLDGWSMPILLQEFLALYQGRSLPLAVPYRNYIAWLKSQSPERSADFWRDQLRGLTTPTMLAISNQQPSSDRPTYAEQVVTLDIDITEQLQQFAKTHQVTLNTLVQGAWGILLSRYSDTDDVLFGIVSSGRPLELPQVERMVGLFINTLPLRLAPLPELLVSDYLQQVQSQQFALRSHEHCSLIEIQAWSTIPRSLPLFESIVVFENYPVVANWQDALDTEIKLTNQQAQEQTNYPLTLYAAVESGLSLRLLYATSQFSDPAMQRLLQQLQEILRSLMQVPTLGQITPLTTADRQQLAQWNQTAQSYDERPIHELFEQQVSQNPTAIALVIPDHTQPIHLTYHELNQRANQLAHQLIQQGIQVGDRIGICLPRHVDLIVALLAVMKAGAVYVPLDQNYPAARREFVIEDAQLKLLLCDRIELPEILDSINNPQIALQPADLAYLLYTSGSTGQPKGVQISHGSLSNCLQSFQHDLGIQATDRALALTTIGFDIAGLEIFLPLISGARVVLLETANNPEIIIETIVAQQINFMQATPATWQLLLSAGWSGKSDLRALCGGEALSASLAAALVSRCQNLWNVYGPTETTIWSTLQPVTATWLNQLSDPNPTIPIGRPIGNTQCHILDRQRQPVPIGVAGELHISGAGLMMGYWQRPELMSERIQDHQGERCYATGDRARWLEDGTLEYLGRWDDQIKLRGYRIELGEIAACLTQHPAIIQAVIITNGIDDAMRLIAYYTAQAELNHTELGQFLANRLPAYMLPTQFVPIAVMPLTPSGKIDRRGLPDLPLPDRVIQPPQKPTEQQISTIWAALLGRSEFSLEDNFFDVGGHSLLLVRLQSQLQDKLSIAIPLVELFRYPTIRTLAQYIDGATPDQAAAIVQQTDDRQASRQIGQNRLAQRRQTTRPAEEQSS